VRRGDTVPPSASPTHGRTDGPPAELASSGKFTVLGKLGEGGMGSVWKAKHAFLDCLVAIKVMNAAARAAGGERFLQEMRAAGKLHHKNIVRAYDAEQVGGLLILVMEFIDGIDLDRLVKQKGPCPVPFACRWVAEAAVGLQHAHEKGMVHRDIKPANLMLTRDKEIKILDFGLARLPRDPAGQGNQTKSQTFMGTPDYIAPEQALDAREADIRADIYSLGCTLYFLLTGEPPFRGESHMEVIVAHVQDEARPLAELRADVPAALSKVVARMLAKDPNDRFQTPGEVARSLAPFCQAGAAEPAAPPERPRKKSAVRPAARPVPEPDVVEDVVEAASGRGWLYGGLALGAALLLVLGTLTAILLSQPTQEKPGVERANTVAAPETAKADPPKELAKGAATPPGREGGKLAKADDSGKASPRPPLGGGNPDGDPTKPSMEPVVPPTRPEPKEAGKGAANVPPPAMPPTAPPPTEPAPQLPANLQAELDKATRKYEQECAENNKKLLGAIDRAIERVRKAKALRGESQRQLLQVLTRERDAFQKDGTIPFSHALDQIPMRSASREYMRAWRIEQARLMKAYEKGIAHFLRAKDDKAAEQHRAQMDKALAPKVVAVWSCHGVNFRRDFTWTLLSNGTVREADPPATWELEGNGMVIRNGSWVDRCAFQQDGLSFTAMNQRKATYKGTLVPASR
jgi:hypothetical protein